MPIRYIGRESHFHGRSLYEIARNLKHFGEGRVVVRRQFMRYEEPSYYRLKSVKPEMNAKGYFKGVAHGEKIFRGKDFGVCKIDAGHKQDWRLIPKDQEHLICVPLKEDNLSENIIPAYKRVPPLMEIIFHEELKADGIKVDESFFNCSAKIKKSKFNNAKIDTSYVPPQTEDNETLSER